MKDIDYILITDIGSTTTKAMLIDKKEGKLLGIEHSDTTVEEPHNDVTHGVYKAVHNLQEQLNISLLAQDAAPGKLSFNSKIRYLATSSAGGGLQILVIGLTLFDSASSAKRAAYGAGGVILDVFAIDDKRSALEQMLSIRNLRPDMILLCGGIDGGAIASVLRLAEILRIAKPLPKFSTEARIPTIYAGNKDAAEMISRMISKDFDLYVLPNLRPTLSTENLKPVQDKIQELFMGNVMERAPGYSKLKALVHSQILPTPAGVLQSILKIGEKRDVNLIAFDIGGATTDIFTRINGHYQRTVSGNLGMSYSALNVIRETGVDNILASLPPDISEEELRNYVGNKTLYPTFTPRSTKEYRIEHAIAKAAIKLSFVQHQEMHYNTEKIGYLDSLKNNGKDKYEEKFEYIQNENKHYFYPSDIDLVIGAGGVFAHAQNLNQSVDILISGFKPVGIIELTIDRHFISPHLGVLLDTDKDLATELLEKECLQSLATYIRPHFPKKSEVNVLEIKQDNQLSKTIKSDEVVFLPAKPNQIIQIQPLKKCVLKGSDDEQTIKTDLPIIIDTRLDRDRYHAAFDQMLSLYKTDAGDEPNVAFGNDNRPNRGKYHRVVELPYNGDILKAPKDKVVPDDIVAVNRYNPPRLYVIRTCSACEDAAEEDIRRNLTIKPGDRIDFNQVLLHPMPNAKHNFPFRSPVRGRVEFIDYTNGMVVASEIQDYSAKPITINIADKMAMPPKKVKRYLNKNVGDFVYQGDILAQKLSTSSIAMVQSPTTGEIIDYNKDTGQMTIKYNTKPHNYYAHVPGEVIRTEEEKAIEIIYEAERLEACIGWGNPIHGNLIWNESPAEFSATIPDGSIVALGYRPTAQELKQISKAGVVGIIASAVSEAEAVAYLGKEQGVINTGFESIPATLILIQGFGDLDYSPAQREFLIAQQNKNCLLEPHTRIRAGVVRASISIID